jgi:hypothetical protein
MDFDELNRQLQELGVKPKDELRAALYIDYLVQSKVFLWGLKSSLPDKGYAFVKNAVRSQNLLNELAEVLDFFVAPAVAADLKRAYADPPHGLWHGGDDGWTYRDYFENVILDKNEMRYQIKLEAFRKMYPITHHALDRLSNNFERNIAEMCTRVFKDRDLLIHFYRDLYNNSLNITSLDKIKSTGSDFHKGGKQVLILTFAITYQKAGTHAPTIEKLRVVYKPSDLEIDCLIAGDSAAVNRVVPSFMGKSLFEIYNSRAVQSPGRESLDTYRILPRRFISAYKGKHPLPIREAYGYIQYLNHKVSVSGRMIFGLEFLELGESDYLIFPDDKTKSEIIDKFYYKSGAFAALACTFSIGDMHCENIRVMKYSPYPIDLEVSVTKEVNDIRDTDLLTKDAVGGIDGLFSVEKGGWAIAKPLAKGKASINREDKAEKHHQNRLWSVAHPGNKTPIPVSEAALLKGFTIGMTILSECQKTNAFDSWFARIQHVVVRYLIASTGDLAGIRDQCFLGNPKLLPNQELRPTLEKLLQKEYKELEKGYVQGDNPNFIYPKLKQTEDDLLNLDIPVFYHRIGTSYIVDSLGEEVRFTANTFFGEPPTERNVKQKQVQISEDKHAERRKTIEKSIEDTLLNNLLNEKRAAEGGFGKPLCEVFIPIK